MDQSILSSAAAIVTATDRLVEALTWRQMARAKVPFERRLRLTMARMFAAQQRRVLGDWLPEASRTMRLQEAAVPPALLRILDLILLQDAATWSESMAAQLAGAFAAAAVAQSVSLQGSFDLSRERILELMRERAADRVTGINETTRDRVRDLIVASVEENASYTTIATRLRQMFVDFRSPAPQRHIRDRAELIAITEVGQAYVDGQLIVLNQMEDAGVAMEKRWLTVGDDRVSDGCKANQAVGWIPLRTAFPSGHQSPLRFPGCRCSVLARQIER